MESNESNLPPTSQPVSIAPTVYFIPLGTRYIYDTKS